MLSVVSANAPGIMSRRAPRACPVCRNEATGCGPAGVCPVNRAMKVPPLGIVIGSK